MCDTAETSWVLRYPFTVKNRLGFHFFIGTYALFLGEMSA